MVDVQGTSDQHFAAVREAFEENFATHPDLEFGASLCVMVNGEPVVDLWGGWADGAKGRAWERDTIVNVFSSTMNAVGLCALLLVDRGELDPDEHVTHYWPEYGQQGKAGTKVREILDGRE